MKFLLTPTFIVSAFILASCAGTPTTYSEPSGPESDTAASEASADPDFGAKCIQRIKAGLSNPNAAEIALDGGKDEMQAKVTMTDPENGQKAYQDYICKLDEDRAVTAKLITG